jgi:hypothetical protein
MLEKSKFFEGLGLRVAFQYKTVVTYAIFINN